MVNFSLSFGIDNLLSIFIINNRSLLNLTIILTFIAFKSKIKLWTSLPGTGLLIWHVDLNADQKNFLKLEQADGRDDLVDTFNFGAADSSDPFPGTSANQQFTDTTTPNSKSRAGETTGIKVEQINQLSDNTITALITPSSQLNGTTLSYDETYPQFFGIGHLMVILIGPMNTMPYVLLQLNKDN